MSEQAQGSPASESASVNVPIEVTPEVTESDSVRPETYKRDLDKAAGEARKKGEQKGEERGRTAAQNELLQSYGLESLDDLHNIVQERRQAQEAQATEAEKLSKSLEKTSKALAEKEAELEETYAHIAQMTQDNALRDAFIEAGVNPEKMSVALRQADTDSLDVDDDGSVTGVKEAVKAVKQVLPEIFRQQNRTIGAGSNPGTDQLSQPGFDAMDSSKFQEFKKRVLRGERIPLK